MEDRKQGSQTCLMSHPPSFLTCANVVGKKEGQGPLAEFFDLILSDDRAGKESWEQAETAMQTRALAIALEKAGLSPEDVDWLFAGDLLNQCISSAYAARGQDIPYFGLYGACSTMGEALALGAMTLDGGFGRCAAAVASSHFCTAERQYRTPLEYGAQRTPTAQWTVTGAGAALLIREGPGPYITHVTVGKILDMGITDANNMGAAMAPAAAHTIAAHLRDTGRAPGFYDLIVTGDLGILGSQLLCDLLAQENISLPNHADCGAMIFHPEKQDVHCGGSGCGCCASVLTGYLIRGLQSGRWKHILFCPTGALHSPTAITQGESIPGICHAIAISSTREGH